MRPLAVALIAAVLTSLLGGAVLSNEAARPEVLGASVVRPAASVPGSDGCLRCHQGIEDMHPGFPLSCVDCHGGDGEAREKSRAHVAPRTQSRDDERVAHVAAWEFGGDDGTPTRHVEPLTFEACVPQQRSYR